MAIPEIMYRSHPFYPPLIRGERGGSAAHNNEKRYSLRGYTRFNHHTIFYFFILFLTMWVVRGLAIMARRQTTVRRRFEKNAELHNPDVLIRCCVR